MQAGVILGILAACGAALVWQIRCRWIPAPFVALASLLLMLLAALSVCSSVPPLCALPGTGVSVLGLTSEAQAKHAADAGVRRTGRVPFGRCCCAGLGRASSAWLKQLEEGHGQGWGRRERPAGQAHKRLRWRCLTLRVQLALTCAVVVAYSAVVVWRIRCPWYLAPFVALSSLLLLLLAALSVWASLPHLRAIPGAGVDVRGPRPETQAGRVADVRVRHVGWPVPVGRCAGLASPRMRRVCFLLEEEARAPSSHAQLRPRSVLPTAPRSRGSGRCRWRWTAATWASCGCCWRREAPTPTPRTRCAPASLSSDACLRSRCLTSLTRRTLPARRHAAAQDGTPVIHHVATCGKGASADLALLLARAGADVDATDQARPRRSSCRS